MDDINQIARELVDAIRRCGGFYATEVKVAKAAIEKALKHTNDGWHRVFKAQEKRHRAAHASEPWIVLQSKSHDKRRLKIGANEILMLPTSAAFTLRDRHNATLQQSPPQSRDRHASEPWTPQMLSRLFDSECSPEQAIERICSLHQDAIERAYHASEPFEISDCTDGGLWLEFNCAGGDRAWFSESSRESVERVVAAHNATLKSASPQSRDRHASEICTCNKENRGASQHSSHCLAEQSATKAPTSATKVQLKPNHASELTDQIAAEAQQIADEYTFPESALNAKLSDRIKSAIEKAIEPKDREITRLAWLCGESRAAHASEPWDLLEEAMATLNPATSLYKDIKHAIEAHKTKAEDTPA